MSVRLALWSEVNNINHSATEAHVNNEPYEAGVIKISKGFEPNR
jgi:hypothetical protein